MSHRTVPAAIRLLRPAQAYKCLIVFLPAIFHGGGAIHTWGGLLLRIALAWALASALVYALNDIADLRRDRDDPARAHRPLAAGELGLRSAWVMAGLCAAMLAGLMAFSPRRLGIYLGAYLLINLAYSLGLKRQAGLQQASVAAGFWLRLLSGATPLIPVGLTVWAAAFTLGLAYYLNALKAFSRASDAETKWGHGIGAALAGSLALVSLCGVCFARSAQGSMRVPELPPLFALIAMHRAAMRTCLPRSRKEQAASFLGDPITLLAIGGFVAMFLWT
ncbi:MAG: UbiA family prenyltransferase [Acidobacteria bacterium]|nr:UbiA family prenyltransferase [Acidobacteriota bacterium]